MLWSLVNKVPAQVRQTDQIKVCKDIFIRVHMFPMRKQIESPRFIGGDASTATGGITGGNQGQTLPETLRQSVSQELNSVLRNSVLQPLDGLRNYKRAREKSMYVCGLKSLRS